MLGQRLQELRGGCGWSQVEVAKRLRVTKQTVSNWENENIIQCVNRLSSGHGKCAETEC